MFSRRLLQTALATLLIGSSTFGGDASDTYTCQTPQGPLTLILQPEQDHLAGEIHYGGRTLPIVANRSGDRLSGTLQAPGRAVAFIGSLNGGHLTFTTNGMTYELQKDAVASASAVAGQGVVAAPAGHWTDIVFNDNSGSISLPDGWRIVALTNGCPAVVGPSGQMVALGQRLAYSQNTVPYGKAADLAKVIWTRYASAFNPPVTIVQLLGSQDGGPTADGGQVGSIDFIADLGQPGRTQRMRGHLMLACTPPDGTGTWKGIYSAMLAPPDAYEASAPIMAGIWNSWKLNTQQLAANARANAAAELAQWRANNAGPVAPYHGPIDFTGGAVARAQATMHGSAIRAEDIGDILGNTGQAINTRTGALVPLGTSSVYELNQATNSNDYRRFRLTPEQ